MTIDTCFENFSCAVLKALAASTPRRRPGDVLRSPIPVGLENLLRWQVTRDPTLRAEVNRLQRSVTRRLKEELPVHCGTRIPRSRRPVAVEDDPNGDEEFSTPSPLVTPGRIALSDSEKAEALTEFGDAGSAGDRSFGPGSYWDG